ncbi:MAG: hypothetical protein KFF73_03285 [Cyclobacteriaceae bacterium]|nr:hypothetical protein [Cyclobacteriaceae bacterium]
MGKAGKIIHGSNSFPGYGYVALVLVLISWYFNWALEGLRTHLLFFPLWLGYCLFVDALVKKRKGNSLLTRNWKKYAGLFFLSIPVWWFFELINKRSQNWEYLGRESFSDLEYFLLASLSFSTVIPAVFGTAELIGTIPWMKGDIRGPRIPETRKSLHILLTIGLLSLALLLLWPGIFYMFVWISAYLIIDVINARLGNRNLIHFSDRRNWQPMVCLATGCLACGFFWEMWNFYAYPKWIYHTPGVEFFHVFEMPLLGYLGYIPFSFELFAFYNLITGTKVKDDKSYYIQL